MYRIQIIKTYIYLGFPIASDPSSWKVFRQFQQAEYIGAFRRYQNKLNAACNYPVEEIENAKKSYFLKSAHLNIYGFPKVGAQLS